MPGQLDLLDWEPEEVVRAYDEGRVRAASLHGRIARAVGETLRECGRPRAEIAERMSAYLGVAVSENMLSAYASEARENHGISFARLIALVHATGDVRLLQLAAGLFGCSIIEDRFLPWVEVGQISDTVGELEKRLESAKRQARRGCAGDRVVYRS
jgi:hypothetical protein